MPGESDARFRLPRKLDKILGVLATDYGRKGKLLLQRILVNSAYHVEEGTEYDNWEGGASGHDVHFQVRAPIYYEAMDNLDGISEELCKG